MQCPGLFVCLPEVTGTVWGSAWVIPRARRSAGAALPVPGAVIAGGEPAQLADVAADPGPPLLGVMAQQAPVVSEQSCLTPKLGGELSGALSAGDAVRDEDGSQAGAVLQPLLWLRSGSPWGCS